MKIRFVTGHDWVSKLIRLGERDGWCTHVEAIMPDGRCLGAHYKGGVQNRRAGYDKTSTTKELIVHIDVVPAMEKAFNSFLYRQLGKPYNWRGVVGLGLGKDWRDRGSWFCSELIASALEECGYLPKLSAINNHISPRDLLLVLSGKLNIQQELRSHEVH